jgi:hypothetical protein
VTNRPISRDRLDRALIRAQEAEAALARVRAWVNEPYVDVFDSDHDNALAGAWVSEHIENLLDGEDRA